MNNRTTLFIIIIALVLLGGVAYSIFRNADNVEIVNNNPGTVTEENDLDPAGSIEPKMAIVEIQASNFKFDKKEIRVQEGDTVRLTLVNSEGMHDFVIDELNAKTKLLKAGESETIEFIADEKGTFEFYCSVGSHRQMGMEGNFIIE